MAALGIPVRSYKVCAAWIGEKAGRLKLNGHLLARSPLSRLEELEMTTAGGGGQGRGLAHAAGPGGDRRPARSRLSMDELIARARRQADLLEELRVGAARPGHQPGTHRRRPAP